MSSKMDAFLAEAATVHQVLNQDKVWTPSGAAKPVRLEQLEDAHRRNLIAWLDARAPRLGELEYWGPLGIEMRHPGRQDFDGGVDPDTRSLDDPLGWLHGTALYRRLVQLSPPIPDPPIPSTGLRPRTHEET